MDNEEYMRIAKEDDDEVIDSFLFYFPLSTNYLFIFEFTVFPLNHDIVTRRNILPIL